MNIMDRPVIVYGSRTLARMLFCDARNHPAFTIAGFAVDAGFLAEDRQFLGLPQVAFESVREQFPAEHYDLIALHAGTDAMRDRALFYHKARSAGYRLRNYISPGCDLAPDLRCGDNNVIMA
ncbi:MAG: hypothetical protein SCM11_19815, partial [Bacillota bacterium]|nr:hypothetical protein [Bacillota bacterium]